MTTHRLWHPVTGALLVTATALAAGAVATASRTGLANAPSPAVLLVLGFLALGTVGGFAVSGST